MTSNGRRPQNMNNRKSQQQLGQSYSNLKLKLMQSKKSEQRYEMKMTSNGIDFKWKKTSKYEK